MSEPTQPEKPQEPWRLVHREFLGQLKALLNDEPRLTAGLQGVTLEQMVNGLLAQVCQSQNVALAEYFRNFEHDRSAQRQLESVMRVLLQAPAVMELRRPGLLIEVRRELQLLEFALSGDEPTTDVWGAMDATEQQRVRAAAAGMRGSDPMLLERVRKSLGRGEQFGTCESCGKPIPVGRMQIVAAAERCAPCQANLDGAPVEAPVVAAQITVFYPRPMQAPAPR